MPLDRYSVRGWRLQTKHRVRARNHAALDCLQKSDKPAAVHGARKEIKKLRALFRLVRGEVSMSSYRKGVKALRTAADCLAAARDARVMLKAFEQLTGSPGDRFSGIENALKKHARHEARRFRKDDAVKLAERLLRKTHRRVSRLKIKVSGWAAIEGKAMKRHDSARVAANGVTNG